MTARLPRVRHSLHLFGQARLNDLKRETVYYDGDRTLYGVSPLPGSLSPRLILILCPHRVMGERLYVVGPFSWWRGLAPWRGS